MSSSSPVTPEPADSDPPRIAVKLRLDAAEAVRAGTTTVGAILERAVPGIERGSAVRPLFDRTSRAAVNRLAQRARSADPSYQPPRIDDWWDVRLDRAAAPDDGAVDEIARRVRELEDVLDAYPLRAPPRRPAAKIAAGLRVVTQGYLGDALTGGIGATAVRGEAGGRGEGIGFVDVEQGWNLQHEDLLAAGIPPPSGDNRDFFDHGTAVLGIVLMDEANAVGGVGIAPRCAGQVVSVWRPDYNPPRAIAAAAGAMAAGDVLLLEHQESYGGIFEWPAEVLLANYEQIELAVKARIVVVEAAGNGIIDLDGVVHGGQAVFDRSVRDSGAVLVGGADPTPPHARTGVSNYGSRIDCFGWDRNVATTTTDGTGTADALYTQSFGATSAAAAIVAGAALVVQSMAAHTTGRLDPAALRARLALGATPSAAPPTDLVGVMPNLRAIADNT
jgi:hypothetical protein